MELFNFTQAVILAQMTNTANLSLPALIPAPGGAGLALGDGSTRVADIDEARALFRSGEVLVAIGTRPAAR